MTLVDHLRELRYRVTISAFGVALVSVIAGIFWSQLFNFAMYPGVLAKQAYEQQNPGVVVDFTLNNVTSPFSLVIWVIVAAGLILSCPIWLYQLWAFVAPALLKQEKKIALMFIGAAVPLFLGGCTLAYFILPKGISVLLGFTPQSTGIRNLLEVRTFLSFEMKMILIFGISFLLPVVLVSLNLVGALRAHQLAKARKGVIFGSVVFAAVATPSTDPFSLMALAVPIVLLYLISEIICRINDKRQGITAESAAEFAIDLDDGK